MKVADVAVIGSGPAGMAASLALAEDGARPVIIDAYPAPGGHFYRHLPPGLTPAIASDRETERAAIVAALDRHGVERHQQTSVWDIHRPDRPDGPFDLYLTSPRGGETIRARYLILSPGSYDRPLVFPGSHLPGVITLGAAQMLLKGHGIRPGRRILVGGSGPLLLPVAAGLVAAGAEVVSVLDAAALSDGLLSAPVAFWRQGARIKEGAGYVWSLGRHRVPMRFRSAVRQASGDSEVSGVVFGPVDATGAPAPGAETTLEVDTICLSAGFLPNTAISRYLGCTHRYDAELGASYPIHDATMKSTTPGMYLAGDITGIGGKNLAQLQGRIAAVAILGQLGSISPKEAQDRGASLSRVAAREERFTRYLRARMADRHGSLDLVDDDTTVCRCETVTVGQIRDACQDGARDLKGIKLRTRCGMGTCQGKYCETLAGQLLARETGLALSEVESMSVRPPLIPLSIGAALESLGDTNSLQPASESVGVAAPEEPEGHSNRQGD